MTLLRFLERLVVIVITSIFSIILGLYGMLIKENLAILGLFTVILAILLSDRFCSVRFTVVFDRIVTCLVQLWFSREMINVSKI